MIGVPTFTVSGVDEAGASFWALMKLNSDMLFRCVSVSDPRGVRVSIPPLN